MPGPGAWPVRVWPWEWGCTGSFPWGLGDSPDHWEGSVVGAGGPVELSAASVAVVVVGGVIVGVGSGSAGLLALSCEGWVTARRSATDSRTADNF